MLVNLLDIMLLVGAFVLTVLSCLTVALMIDMKMRRRMWLTVLVSNIFFLFATIYLMWLRNLLTPNSL